MFKNFKKIVIVVLIMGIVATSIAICMRVADIYSRRKVHIEFDGTLAIESYEYDVDLDLLGIDKLIFVKSEMVGS